VTSIPAPLSSHGPLSGAGVAKDKGASVKSEFLPSLIALLSDKVDGFDFPEGVFGNIDFRKQLVDARETWIARPVMPEFSGYPGVAAEIECRFGD